MGEYAGLITFLVVVAVLGIGGYVGYRTVKKKIRKLSRTMFGTDDFVEGYNRVADQVANSPKSVNSMTRLMEPLIAKDFPDFNWNQFKHRAENMLLSAFRAISDQNLDRLVDADEEVRNQVRSRIGDAQAQGIVEKFENVHIHQTEIANYRKVNGTCVITIQSAVEYYYYKVKDGTLVENKDLGARAEKLLAGSKDRKIQTKYNMELVYIQDPTKVTTNTAVGATCPNCGAPITVLGHKFCEYCGAGVEVINIKVWSLHNFVEVDYNHI